MSNPIYSEIGLEKLGSLDANRTGSARGPDVGANLFGGTKGSRVENDGNNENNSQESDVIKKAKINQEIGDTESGMVSKADVGKGQAVIFVEPGEELKKDSEM